jgi:L-galactose dehydrogenase
VEVDTILSFCRYNLMVTDMDKLLTPICREQGIGLINAAPLHMRILSAAGAPDWHPAPAQVKAAGKKVVEVCQRHGADVGQVAMRFCLDHPYVSSTLVGMSKRRHVEENLAAMEKPIDPQLLAVIERVVEPVKDVMWMQGRAQNNDQHWTRSA